RVFVVLEEMSLASSSRPAPPRLRLGRTPVFVPILAAALVVALAAAAAVPARAQILEGGVVKAQHGDWQVVCRPPPPGARNEFCGAVQSVTAEDNENVGLTVIVQKHSDGKTTMRVIAPLGVFLGKALGVQI